MQTMKLFALVCCVILSWLSWASGFEKSEDAITVVSVLRHEDALNEAHDVELDGNPAFVPGKGGSIAIIDVSDPSQPEVVWYRRDAEALHDAETVLLTPGRLFLGTDDFHSIDVSNPRSPRFDATLSERPKIETINGMVRRGEYIFAASKEGLVSAIDVSEPATPRLAGALETRKRHKLHSPHDIDLFGSYAVVVDPNAFGMQPGQLALFRVFDDDGRVLSDSEWELTGRVAGESLNGANRVQVQGDYAFVAGSYFPKISQGKAMAKGIVVDLSNPNSPRPVVTVDFPDTRGPNGLTLGGNVWFLAGGQTVQAYDIRDPLRPRLLLSFTSAKAFPTADDNAHDLIYRDDYLYVTSQGDHSFVILRVNDKETRRLAAGRPGIGIWHRNTFPGPGHIDHAGTWGPYQGSDRCEFINYYRCRPFCQTERRCTMKEAVLQEQSIKGS